MADKWIYITNHENLIKETNIILQIFKNNEKIILNTNLDNLSNYRKIFDLVVKNHIEYNNFFSINQICHSFNKSTYTKKSIRMLEKYFDNLKCNYNYFNKLKVLYNLSINQEEKIFIYQILDIYNRDFIVSNKNDQKLNLIQNYIHKLNNELFNYFNNYFIIYDIQSEYIPKISKLNYQNLSFKINFNNYDYINSLIINSNLRNELQNTFFSITNTIMTNFTKMLILKHQFAKKNNFNHYGNYLTGKSNEDFVFIEKILKNNINYLNDELYNIFIQITKDLKISKVSEADIKFWLSNKKNGLFVSVNQLLDLLKILVKKYFGLILIDNNNIQVWDNSVKTLCIYDDNNTLLGYLFLDLLYKKNKIQCPKVVIINDYYNYEQIKLPCIALIAGYNSLDEKILNLNDSLYLFKQFGFIIHHSSHKCKFGLNNIDTDLYNFMPCLMENIFWNTESLSYICDNNDLIDYLINIYKVEKIYYLFFSSINGLFDLLIHTSEPFVNICKELAKDENNLHIHINKLYFNLYDTLVSKFKICFSYNRNFINPNLIYKIINGDACILYNVIISNIMSFNLFNNLNKNNIVKFRKTVLENPNDYFKNLLYQFSTQFSFDLFEIDKFIEYLKDNSFSKINTKQRIVKERINKISI